jgi:diketogulonate reductase-like aldo/keto reductase
MSIPFTTTVRGVDVPTIGYGTWEVEGDDAVEGVSDALVAGYRHLDTAYIYGNEELVGEGIARSGVARDDFWLTTKVWKDAYAPDDVRASAERSLRSLRTDHLDLLLLHWPVGGDQVMVDALGALVGLKEQGSIRELGVCNVPAGMLARLHDAVPQLFADQVEFHAQLGAQRLLDVAGPREVMVTAYSPLGNGKGIIEADAVQDIASARGATPAQVAIAYLARLDGVTVLPRSTNPDRRRENLAALEVDLTADDVAALDELSRTGRRVVDPPWSPDWED